MIPKYVFFTKGVGQHKEKLEAFEAALRTAGIEKYNLVSVSSILPPKCKIISKQAGLKKLKPGQIIYTVLARNQVKGNKLVAASIGAAIPNNNNTYGYISEHHSLGQTEKRAGDYAEKMAATMLRTKQGLKTKIAKTKNITAAAKGSKNKLWTSAIAAAVFVP